jgi:hypothetical protein
MADGLARQHPSDTTDVLAETEHELKGIPLRYGVGLGCLSADLKSKAIGVDGPCFHRAREAITEGRRLGRWATVSGFGDDDNLLNAVLGLIGAIRSQWTDIQSETVYLARNLDTQKDVARELGRHTSTISKALKSASFETVDAGERAAELILSRHGRTTPPHAEHGRA